MRLKADLMTKEDMNRALKRMSHQVLECNQGADNIVILGIKRRGLPLAEALSSNIKAIEGVDVPVGELDISLYRDDAPRNLDDPVVTDCHITFAITGKDVILVDDVLYTGRTVRAALGCNFQVWSCFDNTTCCAHRQRAQENSRSELIT